MNREIGGGTLVAVALLVTALGIGACGSPNTHESKGAYEHAEAAKYLANCCALRRRGQCTAEQEQGRHS